MPVYISFACRDFDSFLVISAGIGQFGAIRQKCQNLAGGVRVVAAAVEGRGEEPMKWGAIGVAGVVGLAVLGGLLWLAVQFDTSEESTFVLKYKKSFVESCVASTEAKLVASGKIIIDEMKSKVRDICTCGADVSAEEFTKQGDVSLAELTKLQNDPAFMEKVPRIMQACNMRTNAQ